MGGVQGAFEVLTQSGIEEGLRFAYAISQFAPAGIVVGGAAVLAGLLGAAGLKKVRAAKPPVPSRTGIPWVLGVALLMTHFAAAVPADAAVVCRKGQSSRLVLRAHGCRAREHAVEARELGLDRETTCVEDIEMAWSELDVLRMQFESARDLAERLALQPWPGAETWLVLEAARIAETLARLDDVTDALGVTAAADPIARMRAMITERWDHPVEACTAALDLLPQLEEALPAAGAA